MYKLSMKGREQKLIATLVMLIILGGVFILVQDNKISSPYKEVNTDGQVASPILNSREMFVTYVNIKNKLSFEYPNEYYLKEQREAIDSDKELLTVTLVENTKENVDFLEGRSTDVREGPTSITLKVYPNPDQLSPVEWSSYDPNWNVANSALTPIEVVGEIGVSYTWSGLYEGRSVILSKDNHILVFSVTKMNNDDQIIKDFEAILNSTAFTN